MVSQILLSQFPNFIHQIDCLALSLQNWFLFESQNKTFGKIEMASAIFWDYLGMFREYGPKNIFFRNKTFLLFKKQRNCTKNLTKKAGKSNFLAIFSKHAKIIPKDGASRLNFPEGFENNNRLKKLNELKVCEVSRIKISNWTWKFQLSILKNKKVLFLKKIFLGLYRQGTSKRWR